MANPNPNDSRLPPVIAEQLEKARVSLVKALRRNRTVSDAFVAYANARRLSAGETALHPDTDAELLAIIRGRAQTMTELLALVEASKQLDPDDDEAPGATEDEDEDED